MTHQRLARRLPAAGSDLPPLFAVPRVPAAEPYRSRLKRAVDVIGALVLGILTLPVLVAAVACVKLRSPREPAFYRGRRIGFRGEPFRMWKVRTMVGDADRFEPAARRGSRSVFLKLEGDPRVTPIGRFLRKYSIDELPQLWNVLKGEMSLVGPRPLLPGDFDRLPLKTQLERFSTRPGITGLWQVSGRSRTSDERRMELDVEYVRRWTPWLDMEILARTVPAVLRADGAY